MESDHTGHSEIDTLPEAVVKEGKIPISIVWIVPLVALVIGGWLVYRTWSEKGPVITISFKTAQGLEAGKTHIKYKDVTVGRVEKIELSPDLSKVLVRAQLTKGTETLLTQGTRFWVVRARLSAGEISGLGTLFSGAYIGMDPGPAGKAERHFTGLEVPPVVTTDLPGAHFTLRADRLGSLDVGSPVYYRQIKVGQVVGYHLEESGKAVIVNIFISAPHHRLVDTNTRFWNAGGLDVALDVSGVQVKTESIMALLLGGIAFETSANLEPGKPVEAGHRFTLYTSRKEIYEKTYAHKFNWLLYFDGSVRGLFPGAPVEFRGIRVGKVLDVNLELDPENGICRIPVLIETTPERFWPAHTEFDASKQKAFMGALVEKGLRARLKTGSLITGKRLVELDLFPEAGMAAIDWSGRYPVLPTLPGPTEEILDSLGRLLVKLERIPIEDISRELKGTLQGANRLVNAAALHESVVAFRETLEEIQALAGRLNSIAVPEFSAGMGQLTKAFKRLDSLVQNLNDSSIPALSALLQEAQGTLSDMDRFVSTEASLYQELKGALSEIAGAARAVRVMADYLSRHPEALIYGKGKEQ
ncbi:MAG: MCE family protein [Deltaproteobacteria bacterium]|nr:MCE family protein [Deltaproteobacteria bacterium]